MRTLAFVTRAFVGIVLLSLVATGQSWLGLVGLIPLVSAFAQACPAYTRRGIGAGGLAAKAVEKVLGRMPSTFAAGEILGAATVRVTRSLRSPPH